MPNAICLLRRKIEKLINEHFPINELVQMPGDPFWCNFLMDKRAIYILISEKNIIYIGFSYNLGSRLNTHLHSSKFGEKITSIGIIMINYKDWYDGATIEASLINRFSPHYNKDNHYLNYRRIPSDFNLNEIATQIKQQLEKN